MSRKTQGPPQVEVNAWADPKAQALADDLARTIQAEAAETAFWTGRERFSQAVIDALRRVPRHAFIPGEPMLDTAYANRPQPIGQGQTISQPYIVALMTDLLDLHGDERVLEVGTGSGYQAAILAELAGEVYTVERHQELAKHARAVLSRQGYDTVHIRCADGTQGWAEHAPFDAILVAAAAAGPIPQALIDQLAPGGRMVIPLGALAGPQMLSLGLKDMAGKFTNRAVLPVSFVPLVPSPAPNR